MPACRRGKELNMEFKIEWKDGIARAMLPDGCIIECTKRRPDESRQSVMHHLTTCVGWWMDSNSEYEEERSYEDRA